jgi:hypothetical protein
LLQGKEEEVTMDPRKDFYQKIEENLRAGRFTPAKDVDAGTFVVLADKTTVHPGGLQGAWAGEFEQMDEPARKLFQKKRQGDTIQYGNVIYRVAAVFDVWGPAP